MLAMHVPRTFKPTQTYGENEGREYRKDYVHTVNYLTPERFGSSLRHALREKGFRLRYRPDGVTLSIWEVVRCTR